MTALRCPGCDVGLEERARCAACGMEFPTIDGIVCFSDPEELEREQGAMLDDAWFDADGAADAERVLAGIFFHAHYSGVNDAAVAELAGWLDRHPFDGPALEVGCGPGRFLFELASRGGAVGLDLRVGLLRIAARMIERGEVTFPWRAAAGRLTPTTMRAPPRGGPIELFQGSLEYARGAFPLVAAISLLDVLPDPRVGVEKLDALVAPGGLLLLACPYQWNPEVTPSDLWIDGAALRTELDRRGYTVLEQGDVAWEVPAHRRLVHRYLLDALLVRKAK